MWNAPSKRQLAKIPKLYQTEEVALKDKIILFSSEAVTGI